MKKLLSIFLFVIGVSAMADESYLYWMLDESTITCDWNALKISCGSDQYLLISDAYGSLKQFSVSSLKKSTYDSYKEWNEGEVWGFYASLAGVSETATFVIELFNNNEKVMSSEGLAYDDASKFIQYNGMAIPTAAYSFDGFTAAVPEPTSGVMVLIGGALLALRRRRRRIA